MTERVGSDGAAERVSGAIERVGQFTRRSTSVQERQEAREVRETRRGLPIASKGTEMDSATENKATESHDNPRNDPRTVTGVVSSDKMNKTRSVTVTRLVQHPLYKKYMRRRTTYKAHDENNTSRTGDKVVIAQTRPLSKTKSWRLVEVLERAKTRGSPKGDGSGAE